MKRAVILLLWMLCVTASTAGAEQDKPACQIPPDYLSSLSPTPLQPVDVNIDLYVIDIENVDSVKQQYTTDFVTLVTWQDSRLQQQIAGCRFKLGDIWDPHLQLFNMRRVKKDLPEIVRVSKDGFVTYVQRYYGTLSSIFNLQSFPLDKQILPITFVAFGQSTDDVRLAFAEKKAGHTGKFSLVDWDIIATDYNFKPLTVRLSDKKGGAVRKIAKFEFNIHVERKIEYYLWKVLVPLSIIVFMSWSIFWLRPTDKAQIGIATTSVLASIAYLFVLGRFLPPISYLTRMDYFVYITMSQILMAFVIAVIVTASKLNNNEAFGIRVSKVCRWVFPIMYLSVIGLFFI